MTGVKLEPVTANFLAELRRRQQEPPDVLTTPWPTWNRVSRGPGGGKGLAFGWYIIVAGLTGHGKTLVSLNLVAEALKRGVSVAFFSLEMSSEQLHTRLRSIVSGEDITTLEWGDGFDAELATDVDRGFMRLPGSLYRNPAPIWRLDDIRDEMRRVVEESNVGLVVVDYAQLIAPDGDRGKLFEAMSEISSQLRHTGKELNVVTVALSQMNRKERDRKPSVGNLFGSSRFGFDANQVVMLDHTRRETDDINRVTRTWLNVVKNRHGPTGVEIPVALEKKTLRIREAKPDEEGDWPGVGAR